MSRLKMSERRNDDRALSFSEARYRALFEQNPTMIVTLDSELRMLSVNPFCASQLGYSVDELEGQPVLMLFPQSEHAAVVDQLQKCLQNPDQVYHWQLLKVTKNGGLLWVEETAQAVHDLDGAPNLLIVCQDITERKRAEEEREQLLLQLEAVLENINEGVVISDIEGNVLKMNKEALAMHGYQNTENVRMKLSDYQDVFEVTDFEGNIVPMEQWPLARALRGERFVDYEICVRRKDTGKFLIGSYSGAPVPNKSGETILSVVTIRDISEIKRAREELQRDKAWLEQKVEERTADLSDTIASLKEEINERLRVQVALEAETAERYLMQQELREKEILLLQQSRLAAMGEMIGNIAHQWRQPLNMLGLLAQDLDMTYKSGEFTGEYLGGVVKKMLETITHMSKTIDDFRNFFSVNKQKADFSITEIVHQTLSLLQVSLNTMQIRTTLVSDCDAVVNGFPSEYAQVLLNIVGNAKDALVTGQVADPTITIEIGKEGDLSVVTITDNAGGIPEEILDKIFDPYFTTKGPDCGTGVGLYMSKIIIEKNMGGSLTARNVAGGAQFRIEV